MSAIKIVVATRVIIIAILV